MLEIRERREGGTEAFWWHSKYHLPPFGIPSAPLWLHPERKLERKGIETTEKKGPQQQERVSKLKPDTLKRRPRCLAFLTGSADLYVPAWELVMVPLPELH